MFLLLMLGFALGIPVAVAQAPPATLPPNTVYGRLGAGQSGPGQAIPLPVLSANLGGGGASLQQHPISGASTVASTDCGTLIVASGNALYAIAGTGTFPLNCTIRIFNADPMPTGSNSTGAKFVNFVNCVPAESGTYLWPQQSMEVTWIGSSWVATRCPGLWAMPGNGVFTLNVDPTNGSDTWGVADGLALTGRAFKSASQAMANAVDMMQAGYGLQTSFTILLCSGCTDTAQLHYPSHGGGPLGAQGGAGVVLNCNGGTMGNSSNGVQLFFSSTLAVENCFFPTGISVTDNAVLVLSGTSNTLNGSGNTVIGINVTQGGAIRCLGCALNVTGTFAFVFSVASASGFDDLNVNQTGNVAATDIYLGGFSRSAFLSWTTNGHTTTGVSYSLTECAVLEGSSLIPGSTGSVSCTQAN